MRLYFVGIFCFISTLFCAEPTENPLEIHGKMRASLLFFRPFDSLTPYAEIVTQENILGVSVNTSGQPTQEKQFLGYSFTPGFSIGAGFNSNLLDFDLGWTWFYNHTKETIQSVTNSALSINNGLIGTQNGLGIYGNWLEKWVPADVTGFISGVPTQLVFPGPFSLATVSYKLYYNVIDGLIGYDYQTGINEIKPFFGLRASIIERKISADYSGYDNLGSLLTFVPTINGFTSGLYTSKTNYWGIGPRLGVCDALHVHPKVRLFGKASAALLYGKVSGKETGSLLSLANGVPTLFGGNIYKVPSFWTYGGNTEISFGIGCTTEVKSVLVDLSLAWESSLWFIPGPYINTYENNSNLNLTGLSLSCGCIF